MGTSEEPIRVVHMDDDPDFARLTAANLQRENDRLTVESATSAQEGIDLVSGDTDCVISDYRMPEATGLDVFRRLRERFPELPFILFTDTGSEGVASEAISAGVTDYVIKDAVAEQYSLLTGKVTTVVDKRRAEARAAETERQLHEIADRSKDVLWIFSADWSDLEFINDAYEAVFEQPVERIRTEPGSFLESIHPHDRERVAATMERVSGGGSERVQYRIETPEMSEKWVESRADAIEEGGSIARIVGYTRDITDRKRREHDLEAKNEQLERFASTVAHDLRNPWNVADGFLTMARAERDSDDLETVSEALGRMDQIITGLLELARAGATIDAEEPVSIDDLAGACWSTVERSGASVSVEGELTVSGDPNRLAQAFENLFRNAIEHGGESVSIRVGPLESGEGFYVEDDGAGIAPEDRESVFESGHTTNADGTGFGLAIVKEVIEAHGWEIAATEREGGGARFEITGAGLLSA
ncbi:ATP-binding response regulator [Natronomonas sp.]|uniref:ATP-binding response regulator n=1 Tax=Natronomonas sp. TaxID=2184060 RepID=UPI002608E7CF|nr:ATP-binding protein [Natronomonas sp.]